MILALWAALAAPSQVAVVRPPGDDPLLTEVATRIHAEIATAGFVPTWVEAGDAGTAPVAVFEVARGGNAVDVRVLDRLSQKTVSRRIDAPAEAGPRIVALRAVELLRASLLEIAVEPRSRPPPPADVTAWVRATAPPERWPLGRVGVAAGLAVLSGPRLGNGTPAVAPTVRLSWTPLPSLALRLSAVGPSSMHTLEAGSGRASVQQLLGVADVVHARPFGRRWVALASVGGGAYHLRARGTATEPLQARAVSAWAAALDAGIGLAARVGGRAHLFLDAHGLVTFPEIAVRIAGVREGSVGRPALLGAAGLMTSW